MKRTVIIISLILLVFCFASCNQKEKYTVFEVGGFDNVSEADHNNEIVLDDEMKTIEDNISKKLDSIYKNVLNKYAVSYDTEDKVLIRMADGRYALEYYVAVTLQPKNGEAKSFVELTKLFVYLD